MSVRVSIVGAGPGDPELLTLKAARLLRHQTSARKRIVARAAASGTVIMRSITPGMNDGSTRGRPMPSMFEPRSSARCGSRAMEYRVLAICDAQLRRVAAHARAGPAALVGPIFEAVHGSAPDIAGKGIANPLALMLASAMMLEPIEQQHLAVRLRHAIDITLREDRVRTPDLGGTASIDAFTDALVRRIASG